jgi:hypothetical protein
MIFVTSIKVHLERRFSIKYFVHVVKMGNIKNYMFICFSQNAKDLAECVSSDNALKKKKKRSISCNERTQQ